MSQPHELARIRIVDMDGARGNFSQAFASLTNPIFEELRRQQQGFSDVAAWSRTSFDLADGGETRLARGVMVSGGYFGMLRLSPAAGRLLADPDDRAGCPLRAVLAYDFWRRGSERSAAVGRTPDAQRTADRESSASRRRASTVSTSAPASTSPSRFAPSPR